MKHAIGALLCLCATGVAGAATWQLDEAGEARTFAEARVPGEAVFGRARQPAELALDCRGGAAPVTATVRLKGSLKGFDFAPFEGAAKAGRQGRQASYAIGRARLLPVKTEGARLADGGLGLSFALPAREAAALADARALEFQLKPAKGRASPLTARFALPGDAAPLKRALQGCGV